MRSGTGTGNRDPEILLSPVVSWEEFQEARDMSVKVMFFGEDGGERWVVTIHSIGVPWLNILFTDKVCISCGKEVQGWKELCFLRCQYLGGHPSLQRSDVRCCEFGVCSQRNSYT